MSLEKRNGKNCLRCGRFKGLILFSKCTKHKDGLAYICKECNIEYLKTYDNSKSNDRIREQRKIKREYVNNLKSNPCIDCGKSYEPYLMDYDHVRGIKITNVSNLVKHNSSIQLIDEEIAKCDLVCCLCHREKNS